MLSFSQSSTSVLLLSPTVTSPATQVVIAFRGTTSLANVRADIQVWRTRFPPDVGSVLLCSAPLVHRGFLTAYTGG